MPKITIPSVTAYSDALDAVLPRLTKNQRGMLLYHLKAERPVSTTELANAVQFKGHRGVNLQYGNVGAKLIAHDARFGTLGTLASKAFSSFHKIPRLGGGYSEWEWTLLPPFQEALERKRSLLES